MKPKTPPKREIKQVDYLREFKEKHYNPDDPDQQEKLQL